MAVRDCSWILTTAGKQEFPNIRDDNFKCSSDRTGDLPCWGYNCIAWAAGKTDKWWWPVADDPCAFWPIPIDPIDPVTLPQFIKAFESEGYRECPNGNYENESEKVAIYVDGAGEPTHAARLLPSGIWASKMGRMEDIEHETYQAVEGKKYGTAKAFLKRRNPLFQKPSLRKKWLSRQGEFLRALLKRFFPTANKN
jgi:hypothetical protein